MTNEERLMTEFFNLVTRLNEVKNLMGFEQDLLTPGFIKEVMAGSKLNHYIHKTKHGPDAYSDENLTEAYEYLSCKEGGTFQLDRINGKNLHRIKRNDKFYFILFNKDDGITIKEIYIMDTPIVLSEAKVKISKMSKTSNHIGFGLSWVKNNGNLVYENKR